MNKTPNVVNSVKSTKEWQKKAKKAKKGKKGKKAQGGVVPGDKTTSVPQHGDSSLCVDLSVSNLDKLGSLVVYGKVDEEYHDPKEMVANKIISEVLKTVLDLKNENSALKIENLDLKNDNLGLKDVFREGAKNTIILVTGEIMKWVIFFHKSKAKAKHYNDVQYRDCIEIAAKILNPEWDANVLVNLGNRLITARNDSAYYSEISKLDKAVEDCNGILSFYPDLFEKCHDQVFILESYEKLKAEMPSCFCGPLKSVKN